MSFFNPHEVAYQSFGVEKKRRSPMIGILGITF
jgi:hypothetical protein